MEKEIYFVNLKNFESKKQGKTFYIITYICDRESVTDYIEEELYNSLDKLKLEFLHKYKGIFDFNVSTRKIKFNGLKAI